MWDTNRKFNFMSVSVHLLYELDNAGNWVLIDSFLGYVKTLQVLNYIASYGRMIVDEELGRVYRKAIMAYKVVHQHFPGMTKEN